MDTEIFERYESEVRSYCRKFPAVFVKANGAYITDEDGRSYLDFFCGAGALNYGHNHPYIKNKVIEYLMNDGILHALDMFTAAKRDFLTAFQTKILAPRSLDYKVMFVGPTGTNAMEAALKLARKVKQRSTVLALMGCFHGMTLGTLSLTTERAARTAAGVSLGDVIHIPAPYMVPSLNVIDYVDNLLSDDHSGIDHPAAFVIETVQAEGGIYVFDTDFIQGIRALCDKYDMLMIVDDVQVGCGRTGNFFSFERASVTPDIVALSKSLGGLGFPLAVTLFKPELDIWQPGEHNGTFRGNQAAFISAKAALDVMANESLLELVQQNEQILRDGLADIASLDSRLGYRGIGYIWGLDCHQIPVKGFAKKVSESCFENGMIVELAGREDSVVKIMPPLIADKNVLGGGLTILKASVQKCLNQISG